MGAYQAAMVHLFSSERGSLKRIANTIYLAGRRIYGVGATHLALAFTNTEQKALSAFPSNGKAYGGKLKSTKDDSSDMGNKTFTIDIITPPAGMSHSAYFKELQKADSAYCDCIDYSVFPSYMGNYNSNSYIHGLLKATGGSTAVDLNQYVGGEKPLPAHRFGK